MKPGGVVSLKRINFVSFFGKNRLLFLMLLFFIIGFTVSCVSFGGSRAADFSAAIFNYYISVRKNGAFIKTAFSVLFQYSAFLVLLFISGTSLTGVVLSPIICCLIGLYFGSLVSFAYSEYALKGIAFNSVILIPSALIFTLCILFAATEAFRFSCVILRVTLPKSRPMNLSGEFKMYSGRFLLIVLFVFIAAIIDAVLSGSFIKYFSFV